MSIRWPFSPFLFPDRIGSTLLRARSKATGSNAELLDSILRSRALRTNKDGSTVIVATPCRFLKADRLAAPDDAIRMMLELIARIYEACGQRGVSARLAVSERLAGTRNALIFSHHTFRDELFASLEASGCEVWHYKAADLPGTLLLDKGGFSGWSSIADLAMADIPHVAPDLAAEYFARSRDQLLANNISKYAQPARMVASPTVAPFVFIALQTRNDIVQRHAYMPMLTMLEKVVDRFLDSAYGIVIKRHPKCRDQEVSAAIDAQLRKRPARIKLTDASIHDILRGAAAVFTVNSGVGSEAMSHEVPIYCFGKSDYGAIAHQIESEDDLVRLTSPIKPRVENCELMQFYHFYRAIYQVEARTALESRINQIIDSFQAGRNAARAQAR